MRAVAVDRVGGVLVETYRIERLIAEGSMGSVYEARHLRIPKRFAVKFLRIGLEDNAEALQRFRREAEVVATLEHPNVVGLYDYNVGQDGVPYIVLEYLDGETLSERLERQHRLPLLETLRIVSAVGSALQAAHAQKIIHRDLKPENIMLSGGMVKVVDFGVAKLRGAPELTAVNTIVGTVPYMAPEQLMGNASDPRVDQYALATIAYEMLAGEMAFDGSGSVADVARRVLTHSPPFVAGVSQAVNEVLFRAMARQPGDRFPSVDAFASALLTAAQTTSEASLPDTQEPLPPLSGEKTRVTMGAAPPGEGDEEDPIAPPPEAVAVKRDVIGGPTLEMLAVTAPEETTAMTARSLAAAGTLELGGATPKIMSAVPEPRPTARSMAAVGTTVPPSGRWQVAREAWLPRVRWILTGAIVGVTLALVLALLLR
jgi:serine/threonine-protein kinase